MSLACCVLLLFAFRAAFAAEPAVQSPGTQGASAGSAGALNPKTGEVYPQAPGGALNPRTGEIYPAVPGGVLNPRTGEVYPHPLPSLPSSPQTPWGGGK